MDEHKKIPYGISSYGTIRRDNCYYVDKTGFIPKLEDAGKFLFPIRPRRFGKSSLLSGQAKSGGKAFIDRNGFCRMGIKRNSGTKGMILSGFFKKSVAETRIDRKTKEEKH